MPPGHISLVFYLFDLWHVLKNHLQSKVSTVTYYCFLNNINQNLISAAATQCEIETLSLNTSWIFSPSLQDFIKIAQLSFILWCLGHIHKVFNIKEKKYSVRGHKESVLDSSPPCQGSPKACPWAEVCIKAVDVSWDWAHAQYPSCADSAPTSVRQLQHWWKSLAAPLYWI